MGSVGATTLPAKPRLEDEFEGYLGERSQENAEDRLDRILDSPVNAPLINPHFTEGSAYQENCALCATALPLYVRGYDIEAMPRDAAWRGFNSVFNVDYSNPDNYMLGAASASSSPGLPRISQDIVLGGKNRDYIMYDGKKVYFTPTPRGADKVATAIDEKVKGWGDGAIGYLRVKWKTGVSAHAVNVINHNGQTILYDPQDGSKLVGKVAITNFLKGTRSVNTSLIRLDNAPLKHKSGITPDMQAYSKTWGKMFKRKEKK